MYINWFTWIIFFDDRKCYTDESGAKIILRFSQNNGKLSLPQWKKVNLPVIPIYAVLYHKSMDVANDSLLIFWGKLPLGYTQIIAPLGVPVYNILHPGYLYFQNPMILWINEMEFPPTPIQRGSLNMVVVVSYTNDDPCTQHLVWIVDIIFTGGDPYKRLSPNTVL